MIIVLYIYIIYNFITGLILYFGSNRPIANKILDKVREFSNDELITKFRRYSIKSLIIQAIIIILMFIFL